MEAFFAPPWFFTYEIAIDLVSLIVALAVCFFSFRVFKLTGQKQSLLFGLSFLLFAVSYLIQLVVSWILFLKVSGSLDIFCDSSVFAFNLFGITMYMGFFIAGLVTLVYMSFGINNPLAYSLMLVLSALAVFLSRQQIGRFYLVSSILLAYVLIHYLIHYLKHRHLNNVIVLVAFAFFFAGSVSFFMTPHYITGYIIGNLFELMAILLILINLILVVRR